MKTENKESSARPPVDTVRILLERLYSVEDNPPPEGIAPSELAGWLSPRFGFLPQPTSLRVNAKELIIQYPAEPKSARAKAAELCRLADKQHGRGEFEAAERLWRQALQKQPSSRRAMRGLAFTYMSMDDGERAKPLLVNFLRCNPDDFLALGALCAAYLVERDFGRAERFARLALALKPGHVTMVNNLSTVYGETGRKEQAIAVLRQVIDKEPDNPDPRYLLAWQLRSQGRIEESLAAIEDLFACPKLKGKTFGHLRHAGQKLFSACQKELVAQNYSSTTQAAADLLAETEKLTGCPIRFTVADDPSTPGGSGVRLAWDHGLDHHWVVCAREPAEFLPFSLANASLRIQAESEARLAGKARVPDLKQLHMEALRSHLDSSVVQRSSATRDWKCAVHGAGEGLLLPVNLLIRMPPYMMDNFRLRQRFPVLRPAQFHALSTEFLDTWEARQNLGGSSRGPRLRERAITALDGLHGLYLDQLFGGVTDFAAHYRDLDGFDLSRKLWQHWQSRFRSMQPGDEYAMVDSFAKILGLSGRFGWVKVPIAPGSTPKPPPPEAPTV